jgi:hypothetical protein
MGVMDKKTKFIETVKNGIAAGENAYMSNVAENTTCGGLPG